MSLGPRISFNKPNTNANPQSYSVYNSGLLNNASYNYQNRPTNVLNPVAPSVQFSQKSQTVVIEKSSIVEQIPRPQYEKIYNSSPMNKRLAPQRDPPVKSTCCSPIWWAIAILVGLAGVTLALLYGLNVIGPQDTQKVSSGFNPRASSITSSSSNPSTTLTPPATSSTTNTNIQTSPSTTTDSKSTALTTSTSTNTQLTSSSIAPAYNPAQAVTTASHLQAEDTPQTVSSNRQHRHRLSVDE